MKQHIRAIRAVTVVIFFLILLGDAVIPVRDANGRAGRGDSYRSSGSSSSSGSSYRSSSSSGSSYRSSSSSYKSYSSSSSSGSSSSSSSSTSSSGSSSSGSSSGTVVNDYDIYFDVNSWSCVLTVNRDGSVDATETFDVDITRPMMGIKRPIKADSQQGDLLITGTTCPQGKADSIDQFGFKDKKVTGRQVFTLKYHAVGMVIPSRKGARFQWRPRFEKTMKVGALKVVLPEGATPDRTRVSESYYFDAPGKDIEVRHTVAGNVITIPHDMIQSKILDLMVDLPAGVIDAAALKAGLAKVFEKNPFPPVLEYRSRVTINADRTIDREESFTADPDSVASFMIMNYLRKFESSYIKDKNDALYGKVSVSNSLYLYRLGIMTVTGGDNYSKYASIPLEKKGRTDLGYSMWGNFNPGEPFFFDLRFPPTDLRKTERVRFEIAFPPFVKKEDVKIQLYLMRGYFSGNSLVRAYDDNPYNDNTAEPAILREAEFTGRWEGNRLIGEYPDALYGEQFLLAKVFLPATGFGKPGALKKARIILANSWLFDRIMFLGVSAFIALILCGIFAYIMYKKKQKAAEEKAKSAPPSVTFDQKVVDGIRADDPAFAPGAFLERAIAIDGKIQEAWSGGNMAPVRNLVSQGVYNRFRLQLKLMREQEGLQNLVDNFQPRTVSLMSSSLSHEYQTLHVHIYAEARDVTLPVTATEEEKKHALVMALDNGFAEVYSFTRRRGARTDASKNLLASQCPNCGTVADAAGESNRCKSCGTIYNSGEFDWVLSEITQGSEWKDDSAREVPGLAALEKENLSINRQVIEDRASYLFWRWIACQATGSTAPLARDATANFLGGFRPAAGYYAQTAVGAADVQEVSGAGGEASATVLVLWSAAFAPGKEPEHREHILTLVLPLQMKNPYGFADHSCDTCGAPLPESDAAKCSYCGGALQKTNSDWLLDAAVEKK
jgi:hypothetical protein